MADVNQTVAELFSIIDHQWTVVPEDGDPMAITPLAEDVERVLDEAVRHLYNQSPGAQLEIGGLIVKKRVTGYDVYAFAGSYI